MRTYEVLFILSPQVPEEEGTTLINDFRGIGESAPATLITEEPWGRRRLAYPIEKFNEGIYHLFIFNAEGALSELDRKMKNSDRILRHLIVRTDEETRRAIKLAKKNPKKERVRPAPPSMGTTAAAPAAAPAPAPAPEETSAPVETAEAPAEAAPTTEPASE
ncbi:MAG TPA: 30S ribosomal protein S6 [Thermoanaerobaculia bacterium]|nr:30S ribosomal protein S6 [Thermoanaerobaculia bacterium]